MSAPRWRRKWEQDLLTDGWSPVPSRIVGNEEYLPLAPTPEQQRVVHRLRETSRLNARRLGVLRRQFLALTCGVECEHGEQGATLPALEGHEILRAWPRDGKPSEETRGPRRCPSRWVKITAENRPGRSRHGMHRTHGLACVDLR